MSELIRRAEQLERDGDLFAARNTYRAATAFPGGTIGKSRLRAVEASIARRVETRVLTAHAQHERRNFQGARRSILAALALEPGRKDLQALLSRVERRRAWARLAERPKLVVPGEERK
ncbi:MAG: hypothetical protein AAF493_02220 [Pseudomonadota bacterium]